MKTIYPPGTLLLSKCLRILARVRDVAATEGLPASYTLEVNFDDPGLPENKRKLFFYLDENQLNQHWSHLEAVNA